MAEKLRASPNFALSQSADGRSFVIGEVEPYPQYWLCARERMLFALFGHKQGMVIDAAIAALMRLSAPADTAGEQRRIVKAIAGMREAGVLIEPQAELSRYGRDMAQDYLKHRPFPPEIAQRIAELGKAGAASRMLDLAAGPGSLALELARHSPHVSMMELSRGFVAAAKAEARSRGVALATINESCNRLVQMDESFDLITISQAIHWLDDVLLVKGVCRNLARGGSFFVIHGALTLSASHPMSYILGDNTPLGNKQAGPFAENSRSLFRRVALLFEALDAPDVARHDPGHARRGAEPIAASGIELFQQRRPIAQGFARAFLSDAHIAALGMERAAFWQDLDRRCQCASADQLIGTMDWALLHFQRGGAAMDRSVWQSGAVQTIGYQG